MKENENFGFTIDDSFVMGKDEKDISSKSEPKTPEEDIPKPNDTGFIGLSNYMSENEPEPEQKEPKRKKRRSFAQWWKAQTKGKKALYITITSLFLVLCIMLGIILWPLLNYNYNEITSKPKDLGFEEVIDEKIVNVALFGLDTRSVNSFKGNSDSMMILSLNTETKKVKVISLMRDTLVPIEKNGKTTYGKLNSAYAAGGPELGIKTINKVFGLDITEYATINFYGMVDIIDAVGGIDIDVTEDELKFKGFEHPNLNGCMEEICANLGIKNLSSYTIKQPGRMHANGIQAVAYSRVRSCRNVWGTNNDYGRTDRQRYVMQQLFEKAITLKKSDYISLANALVPCSETSLSISEILDLAFAILLKHPTFEQYRIPQENFLITPYPSGFGSILYFDIDYASRAIHSIIYDDATLDTFIANNPVEKNGWYGGGSAKPSGGGTSGSVSSATTTPTTPEPSSTPQETSSSQTTQGGETEKPEEPKPKPEDEEKPSDDTSTKTEGGTN